MRFKVLSIVFVAAALTGCQRSQTGVSTAEATGKAAVQTPAVATVRAIAREVSATVQATGSFVAHDTSDVAPNEAGIIVETLVDVGAFVQNGQVIAKLDDRDAQPPLDQARGGEQQAEASVRQA